MGTRSVLGEANVRRQTTSCASRRGNYCRRAIPCEDHAPILRATLGGVVVSNWLVVGVRATVLLLESVLVLRLIRASIQPIRHSLSFRYFPHFSGVVFQFHIRIVTIPNNILLLIDIEFSPHGDTVASDPNAPPSHIGREGWDEGACGDNFCSSVSSGQVPAIFNSTLAAMTTNYFLIYLAISHGTTAAAWHNGVSAKLWRFHVGV